MNSKSFVPETKFKPFNLEKALAGEPIVTQIGSPLEAFFKLPIPYKVSYSSKEFPYYCQHRDGSGHYVASDGSGMNTSILLFMAPKQVTYYVNLKTDGKWYKYSSKRAAEAEALYFQTEGGKYFAIAVPVTVEE